MLLYINTLGEVLKVLDRALSYYFVRMLDCWKFNAFIYQHSWRSVESVRPGPVILFCWVKKLKRLVFERKKIASMCKQL